MRIKEFSERTKVSVRTLHYYNEIGLLMPAYVDKATGYRYYDENSLLRMQEILFYRELDFPLKSIKEMLSSPNYSTENALQEQKKLLILKKERLERLISAIDCAMKGEIVMTAFDNSEFEQYKTEAHEKWGNTDAYKEHAEKTRSYSKDTWNHLAEEMNAILAKFTACMKSTNDPASNEAQNLVKTLQSHITENYYLCTNEILAGLGQMYVADERFKTNIDKNGIGTAEFIHKAIVLYCQR